MTPAEDANARLWHPWLRINRVLRAMLHDEVKGQAHMRVRTAIVTKLLLAFAGCATTGERGSSEDGVLDAW